VLRSPAAAGRRLALAAALSALISLGLALLAPPALAGPPPRRDPSAGTSLEDQLAEATKGYLDAKAKLEASQKRQRELATRLSALEAEVATRTGAIGELAGAAYRVGPLAPMTALMASGSTDVFLDGVAYVSVLAANEDREIKGLLKAREEITAAKAAVEAELVKQRAALTTMAQRKRQAERAVGAATAGYSGSGGSGALAKPAPRNPDGSWPPESCSVDDPTTSGCITPRTLHALTQARAAGFTHYTSCWRAGTSGEHPKGRACDFAAARDGFAGTATGAEKTYGDNLAAYFVRNADRLAVLYVIWYRQIWIPSSGWRAYQGGGDPASDHTNHVHLSVY
jgi:hypothetical protein